MKLRSKLFFASLVTIGMASAQLSAQAQEYVEEGAYFEGDLADELSLEELREIFAVEAVRTAKKKVPGRPPRGGSSYTSGSGTTYYSDGSSGYTSGSGTTYYSDGTSAYTSGSGTTYFSNGTSSYTSGSGTTYYSDGRSSYTSGSGTTYYSDGTSCYTSGSGTTYC